MVTRLMARVNVKIIIARYIELPNDIGAHVIYIFVIAWVKNFMVLLWVRIIHQFHPMTLCKFRSLNL